MGDEEEDGVEVAADSSSAVKMVVRISIGLVTYKRRTLTDGMERRKRDQDFRKNRFQS